MFGRPHKPDVGALSALVDGALPPAAAAALEAHVAGCEACRAELAGLRAVRSMLSALPEAAAPRSFRLRRADVEAPARRSAAPPVWLRAMPALSAAALVLFVALAAVDASRGGGDTLRAMSAPGASKSAGEMADRNTAPLPSAPVAGGLSTDQSAPDAGEAPGATTDARVPGVAPPAEGTDTYATSPEAPQPERGARPAAGDDDGGIGALRAAEVASMIVAVAAAGLAAFTWARRREKLA